MKVQTTDFDGDAFHQSTANGSNGGLERMDGDRGFYGVVRGAQHGQLLAGKLAQQRRGRGRNGQGRLFAGSRLERGERGERGASIQKVFLGIGILDGAVLFGVP